MGEGFKRLKRWYLIDAILKASLFCVSVALLIVATFLIVIDLGWLSLEIGYAILTGIGAGLLLGLVTFFILHKGEKRLAKKLDEKFGLREKVQTMHAFREENGGVTELQRESTQEILNETDIKSCGFIKTWVIFIAVAVLALAFFVTSLVMYLQKEPGEDDPNNPPASGDTPPSGNEGNGGVGDGGDEEEPYEGPTAHQKKELEALIEYVQESGLESAAKETVLDSLTDLMSSLEEHKTVGDLNSHVVSVIRLTQDTVNAINTTHTFSTAVGDEAPDSIKSLCYALYKIDADRVATAVDNLKKALLYRVNEETKEEELRKGDIEAIKDDIEAVKIALLSIVEKSALNDDTALYTLTNELLTALEDALGRKNVVLLAAKLEPAITDNFKSGVLAILPQERVNEDVKVKVVDELMRIFDITPDELGEEKEDVLGGDEMQDPENKPPESEEGGSYGDAENVFKSKDKVIDPESDEIDIEKIQVAYGEIIARYMSKVNGDIKDGKYSEELAALLQEYYVILTTPPTK